MEYFYGFVGAETDQWHPSIFENNTKIEPPTGDPNYHFLVDMTDHSINWIRAQHSLTPDKPFFIYFAPGATHAPHHVPKEWIDKFKGKFDQGWDNVREETLARQKEMGIVPQDTKLAPKPSGIKDWDTLTETEKKVFARQMEVYTGYAAFADYEVGRLIRVLRQQGLLDNTLLFYILGDNGGSAEGGLNGAFNEFSIINNAPEPIDFVARDIDKLGGPYTYNHYAVGWAVAMDTPFTWHKMIAANFGGTRNGMIVHWPDRIKQTGEIRQQFQHLIDVAPTVLDAAGIPEPTSVDGIEQHRMEGSSMTYTFNDAKAKDRHTVQYFEVMGSRAIYNNGWIAAAVHHAMWQTTPPPPLKTEPGQLYNVEQDFSESTDLSAQYPQKLKELQELFLSEAVKYHVLPIDDRTAERANAELAGRPDLMVGRTSMTVYPDTPGVLENAFVNVKNRTHSITAELEIPEGGASGVILCQGGRFGGWSLYLDHGIPKYHYNWLGREQYDVAATEPVPPGKATVRLDFVYDGGGYGKGGTGTIYVSNKKVGSGRVAQTEAFAFSADETADVGRDTGTPVSEDYTVASSKFTGKIEKVTIDIKPQIADLPQPKLTVAQLMALFD